MTRTMSRSNNEWLQFYQTNPPETMQSWPAGDGGAASTTGGGRVVATTNITTSVSNQLSRVTRPSNNRRRSRASRRTPTTLLNTDTANFRAMVQRFTGAGGDATAATFQTNPTSVTASYQSLNTYNSSLSNISDGVASPSSRFAGGGMVSNDGYNLQFRQPHSQAFFTAVADDGGSSTGHDGDDQHVGYRQRGSFDW